MGLDNQNTSDIDDQTDETGLLIYFGTPFFLLKGCFYK